MLNVKQLSVAYGKHRALEDVSVKVERGEIVVILGANGAGKSSLLRAIGGMCEGTVSGDVDVDGESISRLPAHEIVEAGIALVPEGRGVFPDLSVRENLLLGAYGKRARTEEQTNLERVLTLFPKLTERRSQIVRTMSGGEQQMVAIGRAMMSAPSILMLDEPSLGLSPLLCKELFQNLTQVRAAGLGILLVEQNAKQSLAIADRGYLLENAKIIGEDSAEALASDPAVQAAYLGISSGGGKTKSQQKSSAKTPAKPGSKPRAEEPARPDLPFLTPAGGAPISADRIADDDLESLIQGATDKQSERYSGPAEQPVILGADQPSGSDGDRLSTVLREIEEAARRARLPEKPNGVADPSPQSNPAKSQSKPEAKEELPDIEVWRRQPDIEVYRRQGGKLRPVKEDPHD